MDFPLHQPCPPFGILLGAKRTGATHLHRAVPCQDALCWHWQSDTQPASLLLAIADGHGGSHYDRSDQGAHLAVHTAIALLRECHAAFPNPRQLLNTLRSDFARLLRRRWQQAVRQHHADLEQPPPSAEAPLLRRYGATLLTVLMQEELVFAGQIGDGKLLRIPADGPPHEPLPADPHLLGSETHSLCSEEAEWLWQSAVWYRQAEETLLFCTDGLSDSFVSPEEFHRFARSLPPLLAEQGSQTVAQHLPNWLDRYSHEGSGDDMTLLLLHPMLPKGV
jgi:serine/threonine protein phosphatase PrpC